MATESQIARLNGVFTPAERALREEIVHYQEQALFYEKQLLKVARMTPEQLEKAFIVNKAMRLDSLSGQIVRSLQRVEWLNAQLREVEAQLDSEELNA